MEKIIYKNEISKVNHYITFKHQNHSNNKLVILLDGRSVGNINKKSKVISCNNINLFNFIKKNLPLFP